MKPIHTIDVVSGSNLAQQDRILFANKSDVANLIGSGAGAAVTTHVAMSLPAKYSVVVNPQQDATWYVTNKAATGFDVVLTPRLAASTLAAGLFDVSVFG